MKHIALLVVISATLFIWPVLGWMMLAGLCWDVAERLKGDD